MYVFVWVVSVLDAINCCHEERCVLVFSKRLPAAFWDVFAIFCRMLFLPSNVLLSAPSPRAQSLLLFYFHLIFFFFFNQHQVAVETVVRKRKASLSSASSPSNKGTEKAYPFVGPPPPAHVTFMPVRSSLLYSPIVMAILQSILTSYVEKARVIRKGHSGDFIYGMILRERF